MAFDGNGNYILPAPEFPFIPGTPIVAEDMNNILADIGAALSRTLLNDNGNGPTTDIDWKGYKLTGLGNGAASSDAVNFGQVFNSPTFNTPRLAVAPAVSVPGDDLFIPTMAWVRALAISANLPGQSAAVAGFFLRTDGSVPTWVSIDGRGYSYLNRGDTAGAATAVVYTAANENHRLKITQQTKITVSGFPTARMVVMLLTLENAGLFPPTWEGIVWTTPSGAESANFADAGITWQTAGRDRVVICSEPGLTPWARVIR